MKLKLNREHFRSRDHGRTWYPKLAFDTEEEIKSKFSLNKWRYYQCGTCTKYHVSLLNREGHW